MIKANKPEIKEKLVTWFTARCDKLNKKELLTLLYRHAPEMTDLYD